VIIIIFKEIQGRDLKFGRCTFFF